MEHMFFILYKMQVKSDQEDEILIEKINKDGQETVYNKYSKGKMIGRGGFANCHQGVDLQTNEKIAIKVIEKKTLSRNRAKQKLLSEIKIHKLLNHRFIVRFLRVFQDYRRVYIIIQLCQNKALSDFVRRRKRLSSIEVKRFMMQLIQAIEYLHSVKVIHRDLKMANIFLDNNMNMKVGDLGLAAKLQFNQERKRTMCGTPNYIAPQILKGGTGHSYEVDVWSAGVICYAMMTGKPPFQASEISKTYQNIKNAHFDFPNIEGVTHQFKDFIMKVLVIDPKKRMTIQQMKEHPFLKDPIPDITYNKITLTPVYDTLLNVCKTLVPQQMNVFSEQKSPRSKYSTALSLKHDKQKKQKIFEVKEGEVKWNTNGVSCYVDYSTKYGLGYVLSNGNYGVYFNDSSLLYLDQQSNIYHYINNPSLEDTPVVQMTQDEIETDKAYLKKYLLLKKFKIYLEDQLAKTGESIAQKSQKQVYLKQWLKTKHAIMFRLNNKVFQVDFFDGSRVSLNTENKTVSIRNKKGDIRLATLEEVMNQKEGETVRRIKYIREILNKIKQK